MASAKHKFAKAWSSSNSAAEVAEKLDMSVGSVHTLAYRYRKQGIPLKPLKTGRPQSAEDTLDEKAAAEAFEALPESIRRAALTAAMERLLADADALGKLSARKQSAALAESNRRELEPTKRKK